MYLGSLDPKRRVNKDIQRSRSGRLCIKRSLPRRSSRFIIRARREIMQEGPSTTSYRFL